MTMKHYKMNTFLAAKATKIIDYLSLHEGHFINQKEHPPRDDPL